MFQDETICFSKVVCIFAKGTFVIFLSWEIAALQLNNKTKPKSSALLVIERMLAWKQRMALCESWSVRKYWIWTKILLIIMFTHSSGPWRIFFLLLSHQVLFLCSWKKTSGLQRHLRILLWTGRVCLPKNDERRNKRYFNWKNLLGLIGMLYWVNFLIFFAQLQCSFSGVRLQILSSSSWT